MSTIGICLSCSSFFIDHFFATKWVVLLVLAPILSAAHFFSGSARLPERKILVVIFVLAAYVVGSAALREHSYWFPLVSFFTLALMALASANEKEAVRALRYGLEISLGASVLYAIAQLFHFEPFPFLYRGEHTAVPDAFFGNPAVAAEVAGLAILSLSFNDFRFPRFRRILFLLGVLFLALQNTRGAPLALAISMLTFRFRLVRENKKWVIGAGLLLLVGFAPLLRPEKILSAQARGIRWANSFAMAWEHPLGIGASKFASVYLDYYNKVGVDPEVTEFTIVTHPHNEWIRILLEQGWIFFALVIGCAALLFRKSKENIPFVREALLFLSMEALFHGNFLSAPSAFVVAVLIGTILPVTNIRMPRIAGIAPLVCLWFGLLFTSAKLTEAHPEKFSSEEIHSQCEKFPSLWRLCTEAAKRDIQNQNPKAAESPLRYLLGFDKNQFEAWKLLAFVQSSQGDRAAACESLLTHERIFLYHTRYTEKYTALCGSSPH